MEEKNRIYLGDCLKVLPTIDQHCVDLICADLPYGITNNDWDREIIPLGPLWECFERVLKPNGCVVLTSAQPFTSILVMSKPQWFKYDMIWRKTIGSGQLNVNIRPLRIHEEILIFGPGKTTYNEQKTVGKPYSIVRKANYKNKNYNQQTATKKENDGFRHATSVIDYPDLIETEIEMFDGAISVVDVSNPRIKGGHPTQKPLALMAHLIRMFSNDGETVLDCCMGSGSTGVAAIDEGRIFIGIENSPDYFQMAKTNITDALSHNYLGCIIDQKLAIY